MIDLLAPLAKGCKPKGVKRKKKYPSREGETPPTAARKPTAGSKFKDRPAGFGLAAEGGWGASRRVK
jgi:hypothetical protein